MKQLEIEWRHLSSGGTTCSRCAATGRTVEQVVAALRDDLAPEGVQVTFIETPLTAERVMDSNLLLINGKPLERVLADLQAATNYCGSCSELTKQETYCRTVKHDGQTYEEIPEALIREAALVAIRAA